MRKLLVFVCLFLSWPLGMAFAEENYHYYAIACPFRTVTDELTVNELSAVLFDPGQGSGEIREVWLSPSAVSDLPRLFAAVPAELVTEDAAEKISVTEGGVSCAVIPLDEVDPTMKLVRLGSSHFPWDEVYDPQTDLLAARAEDTNFYREKASTLLLTGTTALARTVAYKMSEKGALYPAELVKSVFDSCDITHISNESSIWSLCPEPRRDNVSIQFCSGTDAFEVLDYLGVDVIELTGNHLRDYDWKPFAEMLDSFDEKGYAYYGSGRNAVKAAEPLFLEHNGNRFVFLGCNCAGPDHVYATERLPGTAHCDFDRLEEQVRAFADEGYLVIVTLQYYEIYTRAPSDIQKRDFGRLSDAGAVVVSGSQSHLAQVMVPMADRFIHYGPGNLFFDQMDVPVKGTRQEFLDRYVFYDGRLLNVQLVTALLTDYSRPRLMRPDERSSFLREVFSFLN